MSRSYEATPFSFLVIGSFRNSLPPYTLNKIRLSFQEYELGGNMKGDGYQNGGCLVVQAVNGKALYTYR